MEIWREQLRKRFSELKRKEGLTQQQLADAVGVTQGTIGHWMRGRREPENVAQFDKLAKALNMSLAELMEGKKADISHINSPIKQRPIYVQSHAQIINNERGTFKMDFYGEVTDSSVFYLVETDLMEGREGDYIPEGSIIRLEPKSPNVGDLAAFDVDGWPAVGQYSIVAGKQYVRPSNPQYQAIDVSNGTLIGVIMDWKVMPRKKTQKLHETI